LKDVEFPDFGAVAETPDWRVSLAEYQGRLAAVAERMERAGLTHLVVYGDREHFANLAWLMGFDPRFEEAVCVVRPGEKPLLLVGNECQNYVPACPLVASGQVEVRRYSPFSLPDQPGGAEVLFDGLGLDAHCRVGVAGWKSYATPQQMDAPAYLVDALRFAAGWENVVNAAEMFVGHGGLRTTASAGEIAFFEWTNMLASDGMKAVLRALRPGAVDYDLLREARYCGLPLACHMTLKCGGNRVSLASARGERLERGGRFSCGIAYWGANVCRCGWVAEGPEDLPEAARGYVDEFAGPYFAAMGAWFAALRIGSTGGALHEAIHGRLPEERFHVFLNAGHLIHLDEWVNAPAWEGSEVELRSGMVMQADVIPSHPVYYSSRMEDGYVLADEGLQRELGERFPALLARCRARREFLRAELGLPVADEVLPLSNVCGLVAPYVLAPQRVLTLA
jgi:Xaa-Pro aminopeptidase